MVEKIKTYDVLNEFDDCAIVMQGPVTCGDQLDKNVISNIRKVRKAVPSLRIIVSCWELSEKNLILFSKISSYIGFEVIYNKDPGGLLCFVRGAKYICNINRMLVSTKSALNIITEKYTIKFRTDSYISTNKILSVMKGYYSDQAHILHRNKEHSVFRERILNGNLFARDAKGYLPYLFHPGDILLAGLTSDLNDLFKADLASQEIFQIAQRRYFYTMMKYVPEQYIWIECIKMVTGKVPFKGNQYFSNELISISESYFVNNFYLIENKEVDFYWPKHKSHYNNKGKFSIYNKNDWYRLYNIYILKYPIDIKLALKKGLVIKIMIIYFTVRTYILKFPMLRMLAIKLFSRRG
ncbi:WavE lipopolysaccharide synthesis family protein [Pantoea septica]|uniref:WavE lipopolysaccharide synthesis family protein n=1 Tax=Pantoea septica TaxID=472695 RepID=UPI0028A10EE8|nr:WavE lipopolysaccharide synthesis family protein [Pantoea septica]